MTPPRIAVLVALALATFAGFLFFPGHTWLQSDTQIYIPMLERLRDASLFAREPLALRPHLTWTLYDETALALRALTGLGFREILLALQLVCRFLGLLGAYLLVRACGAGRTAAVLAAACFGLGATINGPAVLTLEYEPVPRGFAIPLVLAAAGCWARGHALAAGLLAGLGTLFHPTSTAPFWALSPLLLWQQRRAPERWKNVWRLWLPGLAAVAVVALAAHFQAGETEKQAWLGRIPSALEGVQKLRGRYNWISLWPGEWFWQYPVLLAFVAAAWWRLRAEMTAQARLLSLALPLYGMLMVPVQYVLLDVQKWILMPQFQPARAVLWIAAMAILLGAAAGWRAASAGRHAEALAWWSVVFIIPANGLLVQFFTQPDWRRLVIVAVCAALAVVAARWQWCGAAAVVLAIVLIPGFGRLRNFPPLHTRPLAELSVWASSTPKDAVFFFAGVGHGLEAGVFRAESLRALYVDWKAGGQANLFEGFAMEWLERWQAVDEARTLLPLERYRAIGVDYVVVPAAKRPAALAAVFENQDWAVLKLK